MHETVNIAIVGFGNIGSYFYKVLKKNKNRISIKTGKMPLVKYISAKNINKKRSVKIPKSKWIKNSLNLPLMNDVDIIIELIGGSEGVAKKLVFSALKNKKHVITANKSLIAKYGDELANNTSILYGGSCKPENARELFSKDNIDGGLIGGASLNAESFIEIIKSF